MTTPTPAPGSGPTGHASGPPKPAAPFRGEAFLIDIPISMQAELGEWNNGAGIDLESWLACEGRFSLAIGYLTLLWPQWELIDGYILRKGIREESIRDFEARAGSTRQSVEAVLNHIHLADLQYSGCPDCTADKLVVLGAMLKQIYEVKLQWQFPDRPCVVSFFIPENPESLGEYQITFWQVAHESPAQPPIERMPRGAAHVER